MSSTAPASDKSTLCDALAGQCIGRDCGKNGHPDEPIHGTAAHTMSGGYGHGLLEFGVVHWPHNAPELEFVGDGTWPGLNLEEVDELITDFRAHLGDLLQARDFLAALLEDQQTVHQGTVAVQ
ncbi:hypothetical protein ACFVFH_09985 [Streptomyces sp. NPDC057697]|uniref:hypothetical protein n=1 Tax=Streptomyces sp. NPDC057697 TaxID=3346219 RepID=UPI0036BC13E6